MDEQEVIRGLCDGRPEAWTALYDSFAEGVWRGVARLLGPRPADVADVVQETMIAAAKSARLYDPLKGSLWTWLWAIARIQVALHHRQRDRHERRRSDWSGVGEWLDGREAAPDGALESAELADQVRAALADMSGDYESLLTAKYMDGDSVEAIADRDRSTVVAVRSKLTRARAAFRSLFAKYIETEREACHEHP